MRRLTIGLAALLLSACGGEVYPVPVTQAYLSLSGIGTQGGMSPLPGALSPVTVRFESLPGDNMVQWKFSHDGDDLARIVAQATPEGDTSSNVRVAYVKGDAPDDKWRNGHARGLIEREIQRLVVEAVDAKLENRSINDQLRKDVVIQVTTASMGAVMSDVSSSLDKHIADEKQRKAESEARRSANPYNATKPSTDLSKYN
jgi:hypothetical protein